MNFRNIALVAALVSVAGVASAQNIAFVSVDSSAAVVGTNITANAATFNLGVVYIGSAPISGTQLMLAIAHGVNTGGGAAGGAGGVNTGPLTMNRGNLGYWNSQSTIVQATNQIGWSQSFIGFGTDPNAIAPGTAYTNSLLNGGTGYAMAGGNSSNVTGGIAFVSNTGATGTFGTFSLAAGTMLGTVSFTHSIAQGQAYGDDANEAGIYMATAGTGNASARNSRLGTAALSSAKYTVAKVVPEPTTMAALGLGLAAMARRRRNKK